MSILVIDVGGTNVKVALGRRRVRIPSGPRMTPSRMLEQLLPAMAGWRFRAVSLGYPGLVAGGKPAAEPRNLGPGWTGFDFAAVLGKPVKLINDAAMQALGSYRGGRMLFLGLGTGLGSALVGPGLLHPLELAHLPYRHGRTYEDYLGRRGLERLGRKRWQHHVERVTSLFRQGLQADHVTLGGGNVKRLLGRPAGVRLAGNAHAVTGGLRLWDQA